MIRSTLANLRGAGSLANELIQNADDAEGARQLSFRFTDTALEVVDDGGFRVCQQPNDPNECPWETTDHRACDFHAFRELGGGSKTQDPSLTGAFGIGFLAVYQITDHPELFSRGIHWILDEADESVTVCDGCSAPHQTSGTTFRLPWARHASRLREALAAETVSAQDRDRLLRQFVALIPQTMIFLRKLEQIEIADETSTVARYTRTVDGNAVRISGRGAEEEWLVLHGDFHGQAEALRRRHRLIGDRHADVQVALRPGAPFSGRLYATLPTTIPTGLPLHLDASFFPRIDRKGILLESGYEAEWNTAAIVAGAELMARHIEPIARTLGPKPFWSLVADAHRLQHRGGPEAKALTAFWSQLHHALPSAPVMWTRSQQWRRVDEGVLPPSDPALGDLLEDLGIPTVSPLIDSLVPTRPLAINRISLQRLVDGLESLPLTEGATLDGLPPALQAGRRRIALRKELGTLTAGEAELDPTLKSRLRQLALWQATDGRFTSFDNNWLVPPDAVQPLARFSPHAFVVWSKRDAAGKALGRFGDVYTIDQALSHLKGATAGQLANLPVHDAVGILAWFAGRLHDLTVEHIDRLSALPLIPTGQGLKTARETVHAGGFRDPLGVTSILDERATRGLEQLIAKLGIRRLSFASYLREHVARLEQLGPIAPTALIELVRQCAIHRETIDDDPTLAELLTSLAWMPCRDSVGRRPDRVYFSSPTVTEVLGDNAPTLSKAIQLRSAEADLLRMLGASDVPRPADLVTRIKETATGPPNELRVAHIVTILNHLSKRSDLDSDEFTPLWSLAWLPADGDEQWHAPGELYLTFNRSLFATTGRFIALRRTDQEKLRTALTAVGVRTAPPTALVVEHVINLAGIGEPPSSEVLRWLNGHASELQPERLATCDFLPTTDGRLERPDRVFRERHPLHPWRGILDPGIIRFVDLLERLDVAPRPDAETACDVLLELGEELGESDPLEPPALTTIYECWGMLLAADQTQLGRLADAPVVPAADGRLHKPHTVLLEDLPGTDRWLTESARQRLVRLDARHQAFELAGVERLSSCRRGELIRSGERIDGHWIEQRLRERRAQLARIVTAEDGDWRKVIELTDQTAVIAVTQLTVRYQLAGLDNLPDNPAVEEGAFHSMGTGELYVRLIAGIPDWQALSRVVRDEILPGSRPASAFAIRAALAPDDPDQALAELQDYPPLREEVLAEFERLARDRAVGEHQPGADEHSYEDYYADDQGDRLEHQQDADVDQGDTSLYDRDVDDEVAGTEDGVGSAGEPIGSPHGADQRNEQQLHERDEPGAADFQRLGAAGDTRTRRATPVGDRATIAHSGSQPHRAAEVETSGKKARASTDRQLISYVTTNAGLTEPSPEGARAQQLRDTAGEAGVDLVISHLEAELRGTGAEIVKMREKNKGFDILVCDAIGQPLRYIEVKSTQGVWGLRGVGLTESQFSLALQQRERYWLYVVEHLYARPARIWWIRDPAGRVDYFHYDHGWQAAADGDKWV